VTKSGDMTAVLVDSESSTQKERERGTEERGSAGKNTYQVQRPRARQQLFSHVSDAQLVVDSSCFCSLYHSSGHVHAHEVRGEVPEEDARQAGATAGVEHVPGRALEEKEGGREGGREENECKFEWTPQIKSRKIRKNNRQVRPTTTKNRDKKVHTLLPQAPTLSPPESPNTHRQHAAEAQDSCTQARAKTRRT